MLYLYPKLTNHISYRLNRNIIYFFSKLRRVNNDSVFNIAEYFGPDFAIFLQSNKQETLRNLFINFFNEFKQLSAANRSVTIDTFSKSQNIEVLLNDNEVDCADIKIDGLSDNLVESVRSLFKYLFSTTLNSFGKLGDHYRLIFDGLESNVCPFCGIEMLNKPTIVRQDYDHLLKQSEYIFSTVNMDNLVPTGTECNRINKHAIDALYFDGVRSVFNSPYINTYPIRISLAGSEPPKTLNGNGEWIINITPDNEFTKQWAYVYNIKQRYRDNVLQKFYSNWLKELRIYLKHRNIVPISFDTLENELRAQSLTMIANPTTSLGNIVKGAFFEFLIEYNDQEYRTSVINYINN